MKNFKITDLSLIKTVLWGAIFFSTLALIYHVRWFIPFLSDRTSNVMSSNSPAAFLNYIVQISNNIIFLFTGISLLKLFKKYQEIGFFDKGSLKVFNGIIISCVGLGVLGAVQTVVNNFHEVHFNDWTSVESVLNLTFRSFTRLLIFKEPQTMYLLFAIILWTVKQFVTKALFIKNENEAFV
jgi:hypothetical protein